MYFLRSKDDTAKYYMKYFVGIAPRKVEMARSDEGRGGLRAGLVPCVFEKRLRRSLRLPIPSNETALLNVISPL